MGSRQRDDKAQAPRNTESDAEIQREKREEKVKQAERTKQEDPKADGI